MFLALYLLACLPTPPHIIPDEAVDSQDSPPIDWLDTGPYTFGSWDDPIEDLGALPVDTLGMELTDATRLGDLLILAGQHQRGTGGIWTVDISNPDAPVQADQADQHHVQYVCSTGERIWGTDRNRNLVVIELDPMKVTTRQMDARGDLACDADRIVLAADGGALVLGPDGETVLDQLAGGWNGVALADDVIYTAGPDGVARWLDGEKTHEVALGGWCRDLALGKALVASCGSEGAVLLDPDDLTLLGSWSGHASVRATSWDGDDGLWVAAWTELLYLDVRDPAAIELVGVQSSPSAAMAVVADEDRVWVADWNQPFGARVQDVRSPEVRISPTATFAGSVVSVVNDGREPLFVEHELLTGRIPPGERRSLTVPEDWSEPTIELVTDDPDEAMVSLEVGSQNGQVLGEEAPEISEQDLDGNLWELSG
ncbi:MAG: hypothetical protein GY884_14495 [Proteobacteria bacterium]|nr:hypothetical protein [Pseudomonadota bacterium]